MLEVDQPACTHEVTGKQDRGLSGKTEGAWVPGGTEGPPGQL